MHIYLFNQQGECGRVAGRTIDIRWRVKYNGQGEESASREAISQQKTLERMAIYELQNRCDAT